MHAPQGIDKRRNLVGALELNGNDDVLLVNVPIFVIPKRALYHAAVLHLDSLTAAFTNAPTSPNCLALVQAFDREDLSAQKYLNVQMDELKLGPRGSTCREKGSLFVVDVSKHDRVVDDIFLARERHEPLNGRACKLACLSAMNVHLKTLFVFSLLEPCSSSYTTVREKLGSLVYFLQTWTISSSCIASILLRSVRAAVRTLLGSDLSSRVEWIRIVFWPVGE